MATRHVTIHLTLETSTLDDDEEIRSLLRDTILDMDDIADRCTQWRIDITD